MGKKTVVKPADVRYKSGEGILGQVLEYGETIVVNRIADEPRFIGRLGIYDSNLPFIAVPIRLGSRIVGVLAAQPNEPAFAELKDRARSLEMVANLVSQVIRLS